MAHSPSPVPPYMPRPSPAKQVDLDLTIVSAKHLKNVNWRNGELKPYAVFWAHPDRRLATKADDSGHTRPVWNERFTLPLDASPSPSLTLDIFHSNPSDTPKPLVGTLRIPLSDLPDPHDPTRIRTFSLSRPSGRPHGKIRLKLALRERSPPPPPPTYFYPPPPPPQHYAPSPYGYGPEAYNPAYYSSAPPRPRTYGGPSAPVEYSPYDQGRPRGDRAGLGVGPVTGVLAGLSIEEEKIAEKAESDLASSGQGDYRDYHRPEY